MTKSEKIFRQVREGYNRIAEHFSATRHAPWQEFNLFKEYIKDKDKILDLACGNGRLYNLLLKDSGLALDYFGLDNSEELIKICRQKYPKVAGRFQIGEMTKLPYGDNQFDLVICVASFHHLPDKKSRLKTLAEIHRVLKPGGHLLMTNWHWQHWPFWRYFFRYFSSKKSWQDFCFPWKSADGSAQCLRFYHVFRKSELKRLHQKIGFKIIKLFPHLEGHKSYKRGVNLVSVAQK
jgi:ubiquinone/menaquinone biosynthesis C-methylase UbiE